MARANWNYIRVDIDLGSHPKVCGLGLASKWLLIGLWSYCGKYLTDGFIPDAVWRQTGRARDRQPLLDSGLVDQVAGGYQMHDYLEYQRSREEVLAISAKRAAAGSKGGRAKANAVANAKQVPHQMPDGLPGESSSKRLAEAEAEADITVAEVVTRTNGRVDKPMSEMIIFEIKRRYGQVVTAEWAARVHAEIMRNAGGIHDQMAYVRKVIESEPDPRRFLPIGRPGYE